MHRHAMEVSCCCCFAQPSVVWLAGWLAGWSHTRPQDQASTFPRLLQNLEESKADLQIAGFGVSVTTLEEVRVRVRVRVLVRVLVLVVLAAASIGSGRWMRTALMVLCGARFPMRSPACNVALTRADLPERDVGRPDAGGP
jgi:hypothetical protein